MIKTKQKTFQKDKSNNNNISSNSQRILKMESKKLIEQKIHQILTRFILKQQKMIKIQNFPEKELIIRFLQKVAQI